MERGGKETAAAIHQEVTREIDTLLPRIFAERRKTGERDIEAVELALGTALHAAGAAGLTELLREPGPVQTSVPCSCGGKARFKDMRLKPILTVLGAAKMLRAYYWCPDCRQGQFAAAKAVERVTETMGADIARRRGATHPKDPCANGRNWLAHGGQKDRGAKRKRRRRTSSHSRGQTGPRLHSNHDR